MNKFTSFLLGILCVLVIAAGFSERYDLAIFDERDGVLTLRPVSLLALSDTNCYNVGQRIKGDGYVNSSSDWQHAGRFTIFGENKKTDQLTFSFYEYGADIFFTHPSRQFEIHSWRFGGPAAIATFVCSDAFNQLQIRGMFDENSMTLTYPYRGDPTISTELGDVSLKLSAHGTGEVYTDKNFTAPSFTLNGIKKTNWNNPVEIVKTNCLILTQIDSGKVFGNLGNTEQTIAMLPEPVVGNEFTFMVEESVGFLIHLTPNATARIGPVISRINGNLENTTVGSVLTLKAMNATNWIATSIIGDLWTVD